MEGLIESDSSSSKRDNIELYATNIVEPPFDYIDEDLRPVGTKKYVAGYADVSKPAYPLPSPSQRTPLFVSIVYRRSPVPRASRLTQTPRPFRPAARSKAELRTA